MLKTIVTIITTFLIGIQSYFNSAKIVDANNKSSQQNKWVDSVCNTMTIDKKVAQLFVLAAYSNQGESEYSKLQNIIENYNPGGLIFMQGTPSIQAKLTNRYQTASKYPLLITFDGEWGLGMRLKNVISYPKAITLGAIQNDSLIYKMGADMARQFRRLGIHLNFAPSVDINTNPANPVIGFRSFGDNAQWVAQKSSAMMRGMQNNGLIATAKHFPGHGDTNLDSHYNLPTINKNFQAVDSEELVPFKKLIADTVMAVLAGHMVFPQLESGKEITSLSQKIITDLLKKNLGFGGLVITDALNMQGSGAKFAENGDVELKAFIAGHDLLLMPENFLAGYRKIKEYIIKNKLTAELDNRVKKILRAKYWCDLQLNNKVLEQNIEYDLNLPNYHGLRQNLYENAITLVKNEQKVVPISNTKNNKNLISIAIGADFGNTFQKTLSRFSAIQLQANEARSDEAWYSKMLATVDTSSIAIVSMHRMTQSPSKRYNVNPTSISFLNKLSKKCKVLLVVFGNPYSLKYFDNLPNIVCGYEEDTLAQEAAAQVIMGALPTLGKLPVSPSKTLLQGTGITQQGLNILGYGIPESVGLNSVTFSQFGQIIKKSIEQKMMPGCNVLVARKGKIVYTQAYGTLRYESAQKVNQHTVYDLASVTKVAATLQALMKLYDQNKINLTDSIKTLLPELAQSNKANITIEDLLLHQAGLHGFLPFWQKSTTGKMLRAEFYSDKKDSTYKYTIAKNLFGTQSLQDSLWQWVIDSPLITRRSKHGAFPYLYSDLGLIILQKVVERVTKMPLNEYCNQVFYKPMAIQRLGYQQDLNIGLDQIAPTENDQIFRKTQIHGTVQDQHAAMLGGVAGHAGLFGSLYDLAVLMQMNLNGGNYGGNNYISAATLKKFTQNSTIKSRRALGWDRLPDDMDSHFISAKVSPESYGHSGYTGTMVWVDPKYDLIFIFLTNRIYPNANNNKLNIQKIRRKLHDVVYQAIVE